MNAKEQLVRGAYYLTLYEGALPPDKIKYDYYTHIFHAFAVPDARGALKEIPGQLPGKQLVEKAHASDTRVILSVGGGMVTVFPEVVANEESYQHLLKGLLSFVADNDYDGIDLDWEHPMNEADKKNWSRLIRELRAGMDTLAQANGKHYELTSALTSASIPFIDITTANQCMDFINVMCYDAFGPWGGMTGNHAPLFIDPADPYKRAMQTEIEKFLAAGVPRHKLTFGLPYYTYPCYGYQRYEKIVKGSDKRVDTLTYAQFAELITAGKVEREFLDSTQAAWYTLTDDTGYSAVDDPEIVALKTRWALDQQLRGVFCWELQQDVMPDGSTPLQDAVYRAITLLR